MKILAGMVLLPLLVAGITAQKPPEGEGSTRPKRSPTFKKGGLLGSLLGGHGGGGGCGTCGGYGGGVSYGVPTYVSYQPQVETVRVVKQPVPVPVAVPVQHTVVKEVPVYRERVQRVEVPVYVERQPSYHPQPQQIQYVQQQPSYQQYHEPSCSRCSGGGGGGGSRTYSHSSSSAQSSSYSGTY